MANGNEAPDLSALSQPGPQASAAPQMEAPNVPAAPLDANAPQVGAPNVPSAPLDMTAPDMTPRATTTPINPAVPPVAPLDPAAAGGHGRLVNMISGLLVGAGEFGRSLATKGQEGGLKGVLEDQAQQQQQRIQAQQAAAAQKSADLQNKLTTADLNYKNAQNWMLMQTMHDELDKTHFEKVGAQQTTIGQAQDIRAKALQDLEATGDVAAYHKTLAQLDTAGATPTTPGAPAGTTPAAGTTPTGPMLVPPVIIARWKNSTDAATSAYPNDPQIQQYSAILANPKSAPTDMALAATGAKNRMGALDAGVASREKQQTADPLFKLESDPSEMTGDKAPAAVALLSSKLNDPNLSPDQKPRVQRLLGMAQLAQKNALAFDAAKERTKQTITDGDPKAAGALLQSGLVSPSELISSRKPQFAQQAFDEAIRLGGGTKGADGKWTGGTWSAVKAESQYDYAKNPKTQNTLNLLTTMQQPGGSIDIAQKTFNTIPGKIDSKTFNKIITGGQTEFGGTSTVAFQAAMTSLADEYAQVLQGGAATETTLQQAKDLIQKAYTKNQGAAAFDTIRQDMAARQKGMVRDNPALMSMYPNVSAAAPAGATGKAYPQGKTSGPQYWHDAQGNNLGLVQ